MARRRRHKYFWVLAAEDHINIIMDHSVKAMTSPRLLGRLINPHRFENDELEQLYQRYICKLQHSSVVAVVALFVLLTAVLANLGLAYTQAPTPQNVYHAAHCILFAVLLGFLHTRFMQDAYLLWVCYAVLFFLATFCAVALPPDHANTTTKVTVAAEGMWQVVFVVFLAYAMMPLKAWIAAVFGFLLCCAHLAVTSVFATGFPHLMWQQVSNILFKYCFSKTLRIHTILLTLHTHLVRKLTTTKYENCPPLPCGPTNISGVGELCTATP